jgi:hypothetical protein
MPDQFPITIDGVRALAVALALAEDQPSMKPREDVKGGTLERE